MNRSIRQLVSVSLLFVLVVGTVQNPLQARTRDARGDYYRKPSTTASDYSYISEKQLALLVPLQGPLAEPGKAIRDGFMAAYYQKSENLMSPVRIYDTSKAPIQRIYQQALQEGADVVIGPLDKKKVQQLVDEQYLSKPTLLLNRVTEYPRHFPRYTYQFSLAPQQEAYQVAEKAHQEGRTRAFLITPKGVWGESIAEAFRSDFVALGGRVVEEMSYDGSTALDRLLKELLGVNSSQERYRRLRSVLGVRAEFIPRRRHDIDMIFLVALPSQSRQIQPLLKFHYAGDLPIYATSLVYQASLDPKRDKDLENIQFCDMPWVFGEGISLQKKYNQKNTSWPESLNQYTRLYAMGMDAFRLSHRFEELIMSPNRLISGATGVLSVDPQHVIQRQLTWARFHKGFATATT